MNRIVHVPRFLHDIHGEKPTVWGLWMTYVAGIVFGLLGGAAVYYTGVEVWKAVLVGILFFDVGGGVVANLTSSTNQYYQKSPNRRIIFLLLHVIQPLLLAVLLGGYWEFVLMLAVYTIVGSLLVNSVRKLDMQQSLAGFFVVMGVMVLTFFAVSPVILYAFGVLFMIKLLMGFSVRRPA